VNSAAPAGPTLDYEAEVRDYLAYCKRAAAEMDAARCRLDARYHPTREGAVNLIAHRGVPAEAAKIRATFDALTGAAPGPGPVQSRRDSI
jgi:hypothetical protein